MAIASFSRDNNGFVNGFVAADRKPYHTILHLLRKLNELRVYV